MNENEFNWDNFWKEYHDFELDKRKSESIETGLSFLDNLFKKGISKNKITIITGKSEYNYNYLSEFVDLYNSRQNNTFKVFFGNDTDILEARLINYIRSEKLNDILNDGFPG
jgi:hypothetical protein